MRVLDFGIARVAGGEGRLTRTGLMVGTPGYMAPEQARGARDLDARVDVFALGCVVYECLTGDRLFHVRIAEATHNGVLVSIVNMLWDLRASPVYARLLRHTVTDGVRARSIADHERILNALAARDPSAAKRQMRRHLDRVAREYERDWPLVASEMTGRVNGAARAFDKPIRDKRTARAKRPRRPRE